MGHAIKPLAVGERITRRAGHAVITLQHVRAGVYAVHTIIGTTRSDDWSRSYDSEAEARAAARHTAVAFRAHSTDVAIEAAREALTFHVRDFLNLRRPTARDRAASDQVEAQIAALETLADKALRDQTRADFIARGLIAA